MSDMMKEAAVEWERMEALRDARYGKKLPEAHGAKYAAPTRHSDNPERLTAFDLGVGKFHNGAGK